MADSELLYYSGAKPEIQSRFPIPDDMAHKSTKVPKGLTVVMKKALHKSS